MRPLLAVATVLTLAGCSFARSQPSDDLQISADAARLAERISGLDLNLESGGGVLLGQGQVLSVDLEQPCVLSLTWSGEYGPVPADAPVAEGKPASAASVDAAALRLDLANLMSIYTRTGADVRVVELGSGRVLAFVPQPAEIGGLTTAFRDAAHACGSTPDDSEPVVLAG